MRAVVLSVSYKRDSLDRGVIILMKNILLILLIVTSSFQVKAEVTSVELLTTINQRLSYMEDVALFKAQNHIPVEDVEREKIVIEKAKIVARNKGLEPDEIARFIQAQISVAKAIQFRYLADLLTKPASQTPRDLQQEVRPRLLQLGDQLIQQIATYLKRVGSFKPIQFTEFESSIDVRYVTLSDKKLLFEALQKVKYLSSD